MSSNQIDVHTLIWGGRENTFIDGPKRSFTR
jgi:hypothetical protein